MLLLTHTENKLVTASGGEAEERGIQPIFLNKCKWNLTFKRHIKIKIKKKRTAVTAVLRGSACLRLGGLSMSREAPGC